MASVVPALAFLKQAPTSTSTITPFLKLRQFIPVTAGAAPSSTSTSTPGATNTESDNDNNDASSPPGISGSSSLLFGVLITFLALFVAFLACGYSNRRGLGRMRREAAARWNANRSARQELGARPRIWTVWIDMRRAGTGTKEIEDDTGDNTEKDLENVKKQKEKESSFDEHTELVEKNDEEKCRSRTTNPATSQLRGITPLAATIRRGRRILNVSDGNNSSTSLPPDTSQATSTSVRRTLFSMFTPFLSSSSTPSSEPSSSSPVTAPSASTSRAPSQPRVRYFPPPPQISPLYHSRPEPYPPRPPLPAHAAALSSSLLPPLTAATAPRHAQPNISHLAGPASSHDPSVPGSRATRTARPAGNVVANTNSHGETTTTTQNLADPRIERLAGPASVYDPSTRITDPANPYWRARQRARERAGLRGTTTGGGSPSLVNLHGGAAWVYANLGRRTGAGVDPETLMLYEDEQEQMERREIEGVQVAVLIAMPSPPPTSSEQPTREMVGVSADDAGTGGTVNSQMSTAGRGAPLELGIAELRPAPDLEEGIDIDEMNKDPESERDHGQNS